MRATPRRSARWASCRPGEVLLVETVEDVAALAGRATRRSSPSSPRPRCRSMTRPTSSRRCSARFPAIVGPHKEDICYATTNRQAAVKADGAEDRRAAGDRRAELVELEAPGRGRPRRRLRLCAAGPARRPTSTGARSTGIRSVGVTAGRLRAGSAGERGDRRLPRPLRRDGRDGRNRRENVEFKVPRVLREPA